MERGCRDVSKMTVSSGASCTDGSSEIDTLRTRPPTRGGDGSRSAGGDRRASEAGDGSTAGSAPTLEASSELKEVSSDAVDAAILICSVRAPVPARPDIFARHDQPYVAGQAATGREDFRPFPSSPLPTRLARETHPSICLNALSLSLQIRNRGRGPPRRSGPRRSVRGLHLPSSSQTAPVQLKSSSAHRPASSRPTGKGRRCSCSCGAHIVRQ